LDPCWILVGSLWDPCGILVASLWDPCGKYFPDVFQTCFGENLHASYINAYITVSTDIFEAYRAFSKVKCIFPNLSKTQLGPTRIPQGFHKDSTRIPQNPTRIRKIPTRSLWTLVGSLGSACGIWGVFRFSL